MKTCRSTFLCIGTVAVLLTVTPAISQTLLPISRSDDVASKRGLYAVVFAAGPAWRRGKPFAEQGLRQHFDYWMALFKSGRVATAGPLGEDGGLVLLTASDQAEANLILAADPAIKAGIFTGSIRPYSPPMMNPGVLGK